MGLFTCKEILKVLTGRIFNARLDAPFIITHNYASLDLVELYPKAE